MPDERTLPEVAADVVHEAQRVVQRHVALASAELSETGRALARRGAQLVVALVIAVIGLGALAASAVFGLIAWGLPGWAAAIVVGLACLAVAGIAAGMAVSGLKKTGFLPHTIAALKGTTQTMQESVS